MDILKFNKEEEYTVVGSYPGVLGMGGAVIPASPRYDRPVSPRRNFREFFKGNKPAFVPTVGFFFCDVAEFRPRQQADNFANHQCVDGGPFVDYNTVAKVNKGWFDIPLEWEPVAQGASVRPGNPILEDITKWREVLTMPNLDDINWDEMKEMNAEFLNTDKVNQLGIQFGFWERMMNLMDVDNAALALMDEDAEDDIHEFLDMLANLYIQYIERVMQVGRIDSVQLHDDWGTANGPFFSIETCRKFFVPPMKKVIDFCHANGIIFEHHCCGNAGVLVPAMIECGVDFWFPQVGINDVDKLIADYKDAPIVFVKGSPFFKKGCTVEEVRQMAKEWVEKYKNDRVLLREDNRLNTNPEHDRKMYFVFADAVYEYSRIAFAE